MNLLNCLGVGVVAANKETNTDEIMVYLPKDTPSQDGEIISETQETDTQHVSSTGDSKTSKVLVGNSVPAKWMRLNSNRVTSPDVRNGTKVVVYQWMNSNSYLWTLYGLDGTMRLETVVWAFSASPNIDENTPITPDNFYIITMSSHKKKLELMTGQGNGEPLGFQLTYNFGEGWWGSMDSAMNIFMVNGVERSFTYTNQDKTTMSVNKKDFSLINEGNTLIQSKESVTVKTKRYALIADDSYDLRTKNMTIGTERATWSSSGGFDTHGDIRQNGKINANGIIKSDIDVLSGNISGKGHTHGGVESGGSKTSVPI